MKNQVSSRSPYPFILVVPFQKVDYGIRRNSGSAQTLNPPPYPLLTPSIRYSIPCGPALRECDHPFIPPSNPIKPPDWPAFLPFLKSFCLYYRLFQSAGLGTVARTEESGRCVEECESTWAWKNIYPFGLVEMVVTRLSSIEPMVWKSRCQISCANLSFEIALSDGGLTYTRFHFGVKPHFVHRQLHPNYAQDTIINDDTFQGNWWSLSASSYIFGSLQLPTSRNAVKSQVWVDIVSPKEGMRTKVDGWRGCHFVDVFWSDG